MRKYFIIKLFAVTAFFSLAVKDSYSGNQADSLYIIGLNASYNLHTNALHSSYTLLSGDYWNADDKKQFIDGLSQRSMIAIEQNFGFFYHSPLNLYKTDWNISFFGNHRRSIEAEFPAEFAELALYGNTHLKGQYAEFKNLYYQTLDYTQLSVGLRRFYKDDDKSRNFLFGASMNMGHDFNRYSINELGLHTDADASYLTLNIDGSMMQRDTFYRKASSVGGYGAGVFFHHSIVTPKGIFKYGVDDLGFISWRRSPLKWEKDTVYTYSGWIIPNIFNIDEKPFHNTSDSISKEFGGKTDRSVYCFTPAHVYFIFHYNTNSFISGVGLKGGYRAFSVNSYYTGAYSRMQLNGSLFTDIEVGSSRITPVFTNLHLYYSGKGCRLRLSLISPEGFIPGKSRKLNSGLLITFVKYFSS